MADLELKMWSRTLEKVDRLKAVGIELSDMNDWGKRVVSVSNPTFNCHMAVSNPTIE